MYTVSRKKWLYLTVTLPNIDGFQTNFCIVIMKKIYEKYIVWVFVSKKFTFFIFAIIQSNVDRFW